MSDFTGSAQQADMYMILAYRSFDQFYSLYLAQVLQYLYDILPYLAIHYLPPILRYKHQMVFAIILRM